MKESYQSFAERHLLDLKYGVCYDQRELKDLPTEVQYLERVCKKLPKLIENGLDEKIKHLNLQLGYDNLQHQRHALGLLIYLMNAYLFSKENIPQVLPKNLAKPIYSLSKSLGVKPSMGWIQNQGNWRLIDKEKSYIDLDNLECYHAFTSNRGEQAFFLMTNIIDFKLAPLIQQLYEANQEIYNFLSQQPCFEEIQINQTQFNEDIWNTILQFNKYNQVLQNLIQLEINSLKAASESILWSKNYIPKLFDQLDSDFFFFQLRTYLQGFADKSMFPDGIIFEGIQGRQNSEGGSSGNSPTYQIIERILGITYRGEIDQVQQSMRNGMIQKHKDVIDYFTWHSWHRSFISLCGNQELKHAYNQVIEAYSQFNQQHYEFVIYYIEKSLAKMGVTLDLAKGTGNSSILFMKEKPQYIRTFKM
ncbi:hypothetical protein pb186bvf_002089 [Paramecium bursaria]